MKKCFFILIFILDVVSSFAQTGLEGIYRDGNGSRLTLMKKGRFGFSNQFDLASSWTEGRWKIRQDTVYLESAIVYDTVLFSGPDGLVKDSLVLSADDTSDRIGLDDWLENQLSGGGQNRYKVPLKFYVRKGRLYPVIMGKRERLNRKWYFTRRDS